MRNATLENSGLARMTRVVRMAARPVTQAMIRMLRCSNGAIGPMAALMMIPVAGSIAYAVELGGWNYMQRSAQNAADSAALAAASVNSGAATTGSTSQNEARATAKKFGFTDGVSNTSVSAATVACPTGVAAGAVCYQASINTVFPTLFSGVIGNTGGQALSAIAIATTSGGGGSTTQNVCMRAVTSLTTSGTPNANLSGCVVLSGGGMTCNGSNGLQATYALAVNTVSGLCASQSANNLNGQTLPPDPYVGKTIPTNTCPGSTPATKYPQFTINGGGKVTGGGTQRSSLPAAVNGIIQLCGDTQLTGNVSVPSGNTVVIYNGRLDVNGNTFDATSGTLVFSGTPNNSTYSHYPIDSANGSPGGQLNISAPTASGTWKDIALYQDPALTSNDNVGFTYAGNHPTWNITGVIYLPNAAVTFSGAVGKYASNNCQILVANIISINGTGNVVGNQSGCAAAGITPPTVTVGGTSPKLVR